MVWWQKSTHEEVKWITKCVLYYTPACCILNQTVHCTVAPVSIINCPPTVETVLYCTVLYYTWHVTEFVLYIVMYVSCTFMYTVGKYVHNVQQTGHQPICLLILLLAVG